MDPAVQFPEFVTDKRQTMVPTSHSDMSEFEWEKATPESYARDMAAVLASAGRSVKVSDGPDPVVKPPPVPTTPESLEWS